MFSRKKFSAGKSPEARVPKFPKIEALRVLVGLSECRMDVCIIANDFTKYCQVKVSERDKSYDYGKFKKGQSSQFHESFVNSVLKDVSSFSGKITKSDSSHSTFRSN